MRSYGKTFKNNVKVRLNLSEDDFYKYFMSEELVPNDILKNISGLIRDGVDNGNIDKKDGDDLIICFFKKLNKKEIVKVISKYDEERQKELLKKDRNILSKYFNEFYNRLFKLFGELKN